MRLRLIYAAMLFLALTACERLPPLARGLPEGQEYGAFNQRLSTRFPIGSPSQDLVEELNREHFIIRTHQGELQDEANHIFDMKGHLIGDPRTLKLLDDYDFYAQKYVMRAICADTYNIKYSVRMQALTAIHGEMRQGCL